MRVARQVLCLLWVAGVAACSVKPVEFKPVTDPGTGSGGDPGGDPGSGPGSDQGDDPGDGSGSDPVITPPACGDGVVDPGEKCDDGNTANGDGCEADCTLPRCGNGIVDAGEQCDDGNTVNGDGCETSCAKTPIVTMTYTTAQTVTVPSGIDITVTGHGGNRTGSIPDPTDWAYDGEYGSVLVGIAANDGVSGNSGYAVPVTITNTVPNLAGLHGENITNLQYTFVWAAGSTTLTYGQYKDTQVSWPAGSTSPSFQLYASTTSGFFALYDFGTTFPLGGGFMSGIAESYGIGWQRPLGTTVYAAGAPATVTPQGLDALTYPGQQPGGNYLGTSYTFRSLGPAITINSLPDGSSITISYARPAP